MSKRRRLIIKYLLRLRYSFWEAERGFAMINFLREKSLFIEFNVDTILRWFTFQRNLVYFRNREVPFILITRL